jgi:hypothetical protein
MFPKSDLSLDGQISIDHGFKVKNRESGGEIRRKFMRKGSLPNLMQEPSGRGSHAVRTRDILKQAVRPFSARPDADKLPSGCA